MDKINMTLFFFLVLLVVVVIAIIVVILLLVKKNSKKIKIDDEFISNLLTLLGNKENVNEVKVDNGRLKFNVDDLNKVDLDGLKKLSTAGVFVTGSTIKLLFKQDSLTIKKSIDKLL